MKLLKFVSVHEIDEWWDNKKNVRKPSRRYVRRMVNPINNNNGEQPSNNTGEGAVAANSTK